MKTKYFFILLLTMTLVGCPEDFTQDATIFIDTYHEGNVCAVANWVNMMEDTDGNVRKVNRYIFFQEVSNLEIIDKTIAENGNLRMFYVDLTGYNSLTDFFRNEVKDTLYVAIDESKDNIIKWLDSLNEKNVDTVIKLTEKDFISNYYNITINY